MSLQEAIEYGAGASLQVIEGLISSNKEELRNPKALMMAIERLCADDVIIAIAQNMDPEGLSITDVKGHTALMMAIERLCADDVIIAIAQNMDPEGLSIKESWNGTALMMAIERLCADDVIIAIAQNMGPKGLSKTNVEGHTALMMAIDGGYGEDVIIAIIQNMDEKGRDAKDCKGKNALARAAVTEYLPLNVILALTKDPEEEITATPSVVEAQEHPTNEAAGSNNNEEPTDEAAGSKNYEEPTRPSNLATLGLFASLLGVCAATYLANNGSENDSMTVGPDL